MESETVRNTDIFFYNALLNGLPPETVVSWHSKNDDNNVMPHISLNISLSSQILTNYFLSCNQCKAYVTTC